MGSLFAEKLASPRGDLRAFFPNFPSILALLRLFPLYLPLSAISRELGIRF